MRVDFSTFTSEPPDNSKAGRSGQAGASSTAAGGAAGQDETNFSDQTQVQSQVQSLAAQVLAQPEIRDARVQSLQQLISSGGYSILPSQVADAMASEMSG